MIRRSTVNDVDRILEIYDIAKEFMKKSGNPNQWNRLYPYRELILDDIKNNASFVVCDQDGSVYATFAFFLGEDKTYKVIEDGEWLNSLPYGAIHRIASDTTHSGVLKQCVDYCKQFTKNIRIDTHHDNKIMQHLLEKYGFIRCGIIYIETGDKRIAYHLECKV
jgi:RimJ/RimL family protein N-acetyltransferase